MKDLWKIPQVVALGDLASCCIKDLTWRCTEQRTGTDVERWPGASSLSVTWQDHRGRGRMQNSL